MKQGTTAEKEAQARGLIASVMIYAFTTSVLSDTRIMLARYQHKIATNDHNFMIVRSALLLYLDELRHSNLRVDTKGVADYARVLGCNKKYLETVSEYRPVFFASEVKQALELLTGETVEVPDLEVWNERRAIVEFDGA